MIKFSVPVHPAHIRGQLLLETRRLLEVLRYVYIMRVNCVCNDPINHVYTHVYIVMQYTAKTMITRKQVMKFCPDQSTKALMPMQCRSIRLDFSWEYPIMKGSIDLFIGYI